MHKTKNRDDTVKETRGKGPIAGRLLRFAKTAPPEPSGAIPRKRLFHVVDRCRKRPVVWITGPAGIAVIVLSRAEPPAPRAAGF